MTRTALLVTHTGRASAKECAGRVANLLRDAGFSVAVPATEAKVVDIPFTYTLQPESPSLEADIVISLGGDGTFLRAAEIAYPRAVPLLGINLGHVGFLAEVEADRLHSVVEHVASGEYDTEERLVLDVEVYDNERLLGRDWALNEVSLEKAVSQRMVEARVSVDDVPVQRWGCDGVLCATPTGSTAYALSAGGPVMWPQVEALLVVPVSAHALFNRPLIAPPTSTVQLDVLPTRRATVACDGRRSYSIEAGGRVVVQRATQPMRVVRLSGRSFPDRLVAKFGLDVNGFRG